MKRTSIGYLILFALTAFHQVSAQEADIIIRNAALVWTGDTTNPRRGDRGAWGAHTICRVERRV